MHSCMSVIYIAHMHNFIMSENGNVKINKAKVVEREFWGDCRYIQQYILTMSENVLKQHFLRHTCS